MADPVQLAIQKDIALREAMSTIEGLLGEESPRLFTARHDVVGAQLDDFVLAMLLVELTRVCSAHGEIIEGLAAENAELRDRLDALEDRSGEQSDATPRTATKKRG